MKPISVLTRSTILAGVAACVALPAQAMTCSEFNAMSEEAQQAAMMGIQAGREEARQAARLDDPEDADEGVIVNEDDDMEGGRAEHRERARGMDDAVFLELVDDCKHSPEMDVTRVLPGGPKER